MGKTTKVTFIPAAAFTGYPHGTKHEFQADVPSIPVVESFAELMRDKGLVKAGTHFTPATDKDSQ
jgi:hypothetical protein